MAAEQGCTLGSLVGYSVRFDERTTAGTTKVKYVTDGLLLRELLADRLLSAYSVIIIDEAHERTLRTDMLLSSLKSIQKERNGATSDAKAPATNGSSNGKGKEKALTPLKVIIMSATLDAERFSQFFNKSVSKSLHQVDTRLIGVFCSAKIYHVQGRQHLVRTYYTETPQEDYIESALKTLFQIHVEHPPGDVLVFLPGSLFLANIDMENFSNFDSKSHRSRAN